MEPLAQKYMKYFYIALIGGIVWQLLETIFVTLRGELTYATIILMIFSIVNIIILGSSMTHITKQRFTECKATTKIARFTVAVMILFQSFVCFKSYPSWIALGNHSMTVVIIEIIFNYRIKTIEHLEKLAYKFSKNKDNYIVLR